MKPWEIDQHLKAIRSYRDASPAIRNEFYLAMAGCQYSASATVQAWSWFDRGVLACCCIVEAAKVA